MTERLIISIIAIVMLILTIRKGERVSIILTGGLTTGIFLSWTGSSIVITIGVIVYMFSGLLIALYGIFNKELTKRDRILISLIGLWALLVNFLMIMHWPYAGTIKLSVIIPIAFYLTLLAKGIGKEKEFGFLTIVTTDFLLRLLSFWN